MNRRWLLWLLILAFVWVFVTHLAEIEQVVRTLRQGQWQWIVAALVVQIGYFLVYSTLYWAALATVEVQRPLSALIPLMFGSFFVNLITPAGSPAGAALFVDDAVRHGQSPSRAASGTLLVLIADFSAFVGVLVIGMGYLLRQDDLYAYEVVGAIALLGLIGAMSWIIFLGVWQPTLLRRFLQSVQHLTARLFALFKRPAPLTATWAETTATELTAAAQAIRTHPYRLVRTLLIALGIHLIDILTLVLLFRAFQTAITPGALVAGYAMGILFWIVSPVPQGIGVVEGMMTLVYTSLGIPAPTAAVVVLAFRGINFWLPIVIGFVLLQRMSSFQPRQRTQAEIAGVRLIAIFTATMGIVNVLSAATPALAQRAALLAQISPLQVRHGGHLTTALAGFALLILAGGLWRRKRVAWLMSLVILSVSVVGHLIKGLDYEEAILAGLLLVWLFGERHHFHARSDVPSIWQGVRALTLAFLFTLAYGTIGFYLLDRHFNVNFNLETALLQTLVMFTQFYDPGLEPVTRFGRYFAASIYGVGAGTLAYALFMLIRPVLLRQPATPAERLRAQQIVTTYGNSSLAHLALLDDKAYYFSPGGSVVAFVQKGRIALALGDPIGPSEDTMTAIVSFQHFCAGNDWQPAFYQTLPDHLADYRAAGFKALCIGHEAIVDLACFSLQGKANHSLRTTVNRFNKLKYRIELYDAPQSAAMLDALRIVSDAWLTQMHGCEKRFALGWFAESYIRDCPVMVVHAPDGTITAFANIVSEYQRNEVTIDLMRHLPDVEHGTMDALFVALLQWAQTQGYATFNLGLSALAGVGEQPDDPVGERVLHYIYEHINQFYNFKGVHAFKAKFHPTWSPRYLVYPDLASLPAVFTALVRADSGDTVWRSYIRR